jgi:hypothetical protein
MQTTIWKEVLRPADVQEISVPAGAEFLCAREQHEQICVWFRCDANQPKVPRRLAIVGTGNPAPQDGRYIGTASLRGGQLMFHVFVWPN